MTSNPDSMASGRKCTKKICAAVKTSDEGENQGDDDNDEDYSVLYCEA
jgi:hypothetical protein